jgi:PD-(D/E)XK endonuclease
VGFEPTAYALQGRCSDQLSYSGRLGQRSGRSGSPTDQLRKAVHPLVYCSVNVEHPKSVGDRSTLAIMFALQLIGLPILIPFGENTRYDLVIDEDGRLVAFNARPGGFAEAQSDSRRAAPTAITATPLMPVVTTAATSITSPCTAPRRLGSISFLSLTSRPPPKGACVSRRLATTNLAGFARHGQYEIARVSSRRLHQSGVSA